jgi:Tfp pilus assembly protein PilF
MSLLQEAIRKAERARDEAQHPGKRAELSSVPLEIVADPEAPPAPQPRAVEPGWAFEPSSSAEPPQPQAAPAGSAESRIPDPKRAVHVVLGVAAVAAIAIGTYFWIQLRPVAAVAKPGAPRAIAAVPVPATPAPTQRAAPSNPSNPSNALLPGLPPSVPSEPTQSEPVRPAAATPPPAKPAAKAERASPERAAPAPPPPNASPIARATPAIHPRVQSGYAAYQAGNLALARAEYQEALRNDAGNRDALLGIAAVESRAGRANEAEAHYRRLLDADPRDANAHAGLLALRAQRVDPLQAESRIKTLLAGDPEAGALLFSLGNQYARQERWDVAQLAYAKAHAADSENPDFAFNHAVSLDHVRQRAAALEKYRLALELAGTRAAHFPLESARERVQQLSR